MEQLDLAFLGTTDKISCLWFQKLYCIWSNYVRASSPSLVCLVKAFISKLPSICVAFCSH